MARVAERNIDFVDFFLDDLVATGSMEFTRGDLTAWIAANVTPGVLTASASSLLQTYTTAQGYRREEARPKYVLDRNGMGRAAVWSIATPVRSPDQLRRLTREVAARAVREIDCRVVPNAERDPAHLAKQQPYIDLVQKALELLIASST